jgi:hypothetical protein
MGYRFTCCIISILASMCPSFTNLAGCGVEGVEVQWHLNEEFGRRTKESKSRRGEGVGLGEEGREEKSELALSRRLFIP